MRALVTGHGGFVGRFLTDLLLSRGAEVFGLDIRFPSPASIDARVRSIAGDIQDENFTANILRDVRPDQIYLLAAVSVVRTSIEKPRLTYGISVDGALNLYEGIRNLGLRPRVVNVSSGFVYLPAADEARGSTESSPVNADSPYSASKLMAELLAYSYSKSYGLEVMTARPFTHIGPGQPSERSLGSFAYQVARIRKGLQLPVLRTGELDSKRDFTDVRDVVEAYWQIATRGAPGEIYNVCSGTAHAMKTVVDWLCEAAGVPVEIEIASGKAGGQERSVLLGSPEKIRRQLGWSPRIALRQTLAEMVDYWDGRLEAGTSADA